MTVTTSSVFSTAFRLTSYVFLRVIPSPIAQALAASFYLGYLLSSFLSRPVKRSANPIYAVVFSLRSHSRRIQHLNAFINTIIALGVLEFVATPFLDHASDLIFMRTGAIYPDSAKIIVRYPHNDSTESVHLVWRETTADDDSHPWNKGPSFSLNPERDWVDTVTLKGLWPNTSYEYALSVSNNTLLSYPNSPLSFKTFPDSRLPGGTHLKFMSTSCILPNFPYTPSQSRVIKGFDIMNDFISRTESHPRFLLLLGDFIYADVPVFIGNSKEAYRRMYRRVYSSPSFRNIYERFPIFNIYDDHEVINNYVGEGNGSVVPYASATDAYQIYNADANYAANKKAHDYHYTFRYGDIEFFVMDTRKYRSSQSTAPEERTMLGDEQLGELYDWLSRVNSTATFKFIVSSVPFTSLWGHDAQTDSWAGFPHEKAQLLEILHTVPNVYILSGDRHEFAAVEFNGKNPNSHIIREFSTSPLSMFDIPFIRTLSMKSNATGVMTTKYVQSHENGTETSLKDVVEVPRERVLRYIPRGNHKWSTIDVDTRDRDRPILTLEVVVDGKTQYHNEFVGTPVKIQASTALGAFVSHGMKDIFHRIGMQPSRWF
ncbi:Metallo-dependent phosphatase [Dendrothele bispora CBS 962.96]|uniref:Metallo-dependent phosphatase n=1 Tax=Dendrothele bispora (strain CBS 962.96) TaxID=1314807 RepID=A0A4V4HIW2_DENBC|nr:Metallo-dependent phosphatase [Dendrothele bispora CBS 962.96]